jgi:hypothetical protein
MFRLQQQQAFNRGLLLPVKPSAPQFRTQRVIGLPGLLRPCHAASLHVSRSQVQRAAALWGQRAAYDSDDYEWEDFAVGGTAAAAASIATGVTAGEAWPHEAAATQQVAQHQGFALRVPGGHPGLFRSSY